MSARLAVMDRGRIIQLGTPQEVYQEPLTEFVATSWASPTCWTSSASRAAPRPARFGTATSPSRRRLRPATTRRHAGQ